MLALIFSSPKCLQVLFLFSFADTGKVNFHFNHVNSSVLVNQTLVLSHARTVLC